MRRVFVGDVGHQRRDLPVVAALATEFLVDQSRHGYPQLAHSSLLPPRQSKTVEPGPAKLSEGAARLVGAARTG